ncbi:MAG TPA: FmdE family protein [Methanocorpusculum sp.]|nr:FmdE family protein [Methanocorpusculum sp.]
MNIPTFDKIVQAHGHSCPGIAIGYKIAVQAAKWAGDEETISVYSTMTRCPLDALRTTFHLKEHPERLTVEDRGELHFILSKPDGSKMYVDEVPGSKIHTEEGDALGIKVRAGTASAAEIKRYDEIRAELLALTLSTPDEKLFVCRYE